MSDFSTQTATAVPEDVRVYAGPDAGSWFWPIVLRLFFGALAGFLVCLLYHQHVLRRPVPGAPLAASGGAGALLAMLVPRPRYWTELHLDPGRRSVRLVDLSRRREVACDDVRLVSGEAGLSLDGGDMIVWKRLWLHTPAERLRVKLGPAGNEACDADLLSVCPGAVGLSYTGEVRLPAAAVLARGPSRQHVLDQTLEVVRSELARQAGRALAAAAVALLVTVAGVVTVTMAWPLGPVPAARGRESSGDKAAKVAPYLVVSGAAALLFLAQAARRTVQGRRVTKAVQTLRDGAGIAPGSATGAGGAAGAWSGASHVTLNRPPVADTAPVVRRRCDGGC